MGGELGLTPDYAVYNKFFWKRLNIINIFLINHMYMYISIFVELLFEKL